MTLHGLSLTAIFNQSLKTGELPLVWNEAIVTPIYKKGDRNLPENYRPISLTCVCCKILEHTICTHIRHHLDTQNTINTPGFRSKHSCVSQLTIIINDLLTHRDKRTQIDMAILDFSKAFDTVPHQRLLGKLSFYAGMSFCRWSVNCRMSDGQIYDLCESSRSVEIFVGVGVRGRQRVSSINYQTARHAECE